MSERVHDLSYPIHHGMSTYPAPYHPRVEVQRLGRLEVEGRESRRLVLGTHTGTHLDAPSHFILGGDTIDRTALGELVGPALILRLQDRPPGSEIGVDDLAVRLGGARPRRLLLRYDWSSRWGTDEFYQRYPYLSGDACRFLVDLGVRVLGADTPSCDDPRKSGPGCVPDSPNHKHFLRQGVVLVEYLTNLAAIDGDTFELIALPLRVKDGDGAPARVIAIQR